MSRIRGTPPLYARPAKTEHGLPTNGPRGPQAQDPERRFSKDGFGNWAEKKRRSSCRNWSSPNDYLLKWLIKQQMGRRNIKHMMRAKVDSEIGGRFDKGAPSDPKLMAAIAKHAEDITKAGVLLETRGAAEGELEIREMFDPSECGPEGTK